MIPSLSGISGITDVAHVIQLAVAPVFLLTGVGAILSVLTSRLGRVVDRFRHLDHARLELTGAALESVQTEMDSLASRARMTHWAIGLCTGCALLVSLVIATLFVGSIAGVEMPRLIAGLFVLAMLALVAGLLCFLREIALGKSSIHVVPR